MAVTEFGNTVVEALSTDVWPDKPDGWFLKSVDTGESYIRRNGVWENINLGLAFIKATKSGSVITDEDGEASVLFTSSFPDNAYSVALSCLHEGNLSIAMWENKVETGFSIITKNGLNNLALGNVTVSWLATRDYDP